MKYKTLKNFLQILKKNKLILPKFTLLDMATTLSKKIILIIK